MTNFFSTHLTTDVSDIANQMMGPLLGSPYHSFKSNFSHTWRRFCRVETLHYAAFHTRKCQLEMWARFSPQLIFLSFDYFRQNIWVSIFVQFHFQGIFGAKLDFPPTFLCFLISQNSNELCECFEDQLNIDLKSRLQMFFPMIQQVKIFERYLRHDGLHCEKCYFLLLLGMIWWLVPDSPTACTR